MMSRILRVGVVSVVAMVIGLSMRGDSSAVYGDPRFYAGQAPSRLSHNYYPGDEFIVTNPTGTNILNIGKTLSAITSWNDALRGTPNSLTKYAWHYNNVGDPSANIIVNFVSAQVVDQKCGTFGDGCNDLFYPVSNIWIDIDKGTNTFVMHELGHSLAYSDQYIVSGNQGICSPADTIMDAIGCTSGITVPDNNDFMYHYEPTYQSANPSIPDTQSATWNAYTQTGSVKEVFAASDVEWRYFWQKESDTGGTFLASGYSDTPSLSPTNNVVEFSYTTSRFCIFGKIYNEVGFPGTRPWSPRSQYSCIGSAQSQNAGYFLSTSDRRDTTNNLYLRVKNFSGFERDIAIVGPAFEQIGCGYVRTGWLATRECNISLARGAYPYLQWYAKDPYNGSIFSYGLLDFE